MNPEDFIQSSPELKNPFFSNQILQGILKSTLSQDLYKTLFSALETFGKCIIEEVHPLGLLAERNPPIHIPYTSWGKRCDTIETHKSWEQLKDFSAKQGLVADGYERSFGEYSRIVQMSKLFLFHPSSAFYKCLLAMTDGAAKVFELYGQNDDIFKKAMKHLTSRDPEIFWTSGQWMTEKTGGSDVSETSTIATPNKDHYLLSGIKWFSSATTSEMTLALARLPEAPKGSRGLSLFYIPVRDNHGELNGITVRRLKDKLGTRALPTAELTLNKTKSWLIGEPNKGVKTVATMLNITRLYNSICAVGQMDRALHLLKNYSHSRIVFNKPLSQQPLFINVFTKMNCQLYASASLTFEVARLLGKEETHQANSDEKYLLRLLTPITKLFTAKQSVTVTSEALESFGGAGYIEDTEIPVLLRDAQVFPIWEGATNVLSLDVLRVMKDPQAYTAFHQVLNKKINALSKNHEKPMAHLQNYLNLMSQFINTHQTETLEFLQMTSRTLAWKMAELYASILMFEHAKNSQDPHLNSLAHIWSQQIYFDLNPQQIRQTLELKPYLI
ncbi:MAG: acyl-CoA dehydrogenase family protein [Bdellovibrionales bacterium]|nr:acyl-CoA dehydrogenase family protein [Bdellovibrionales bacterium]